MDHRLYIIQMYKFTSCRFIPESAMIASRAGTSSSRSIWLCKTNLGLSSGIFYLLIFNVFLLPFWIEIIYDPNLQVHLKSFHRFFHSISHTSGRWYIALCSQTYPPYRSTHDCFAHLPSLFVYSIISCKTMKFSKITLNH